MILPLARSTGLQLLDETVVLGMRANPVPDHDLSLLYTNCAPTEADSYRIDWKPFVNPLETQTRMLRAL